MWNKVFYLSGREKISKILKWSTASWWDIWKGRLSNKCVKKKTRKFSVLSKGWRFWNEMRKQGISSAAFDFQKKFFFAHNRKIERPRIGTENIYLSSTTHGLKSHFRLTLSGDHRFSVFHSDQLIIIITIAQAMLPSLIIIRQERPIIAPNVFKRTVPSSSDAF